MKQEESLMLRWQFSRSTIELRKCVTKNLPLILCLIISINTFSQVTIVVNKIPESTPANDTLYIVGSFNDWKPGEKKYMLIKNNDSTYSITFPKNISSFQYKITRGTWKSVEGDINGKKREDRVLTVLNDKPGIDYIQILSWEDMSLFYSWNIIVNSIPKNTPFDAQIFMSGSFNDWKEGDYNYRLTKLEDGTYAIKIPKTFHDTIWYKFNRGNWASVESRANGRTQENHVLIWNKEQNSTTAVSAIPAWEDLGGSSNLFFSFILVASALQAIVLICSLGSIKRRNNRITSILILMLLISAISILARLSTYDRVIFGWQPKLLLLSDLAYFLYAPFFYLLVTRISGVAFHLKWLKWIFIVVPIIHFVVYLKLIVMPSTDFVYANIDGNLKFIFNTSAVAATVYNIFIFFICSYVVIQKQRSVKGYGYQPSFSYLLTLLVYAGIVLFTWLLSHLIYILAPVLNYDARNIHEHYVDALWMIFALSTYVHTFLVVRKPELFKLKEEEEDKKTPFQRENLESLKTALGILMKKQKPYLNSKLALQDLADKMNVNLHTLSWIINDGYNKNFFDFINDYRIEEFKRLATTEQYKNYTFLAIAMDVGFSSKTTFNRAFKKSTGKTPREFFSDVQEGQLKDLGE
jgi:AraC-like DNA-binding protein